MSTCQPHRVEQLKYCRFVVLAQNCRLGVIYFPGRGNLLAMKPLFEESGFGFCKVGVSFTIYLLSFFMDLAFFAQGER